jgi:hypothetical protein
VGNNSLYACGNLPKIRFNKLKCKLRFFLNLTKYYLIEEKTNIGILKDDGYRIECPSYLWLGNTLTCQLSLFSTSGSLSIDIDFGDGTAKNLLTNSKIVNFDKTYIETGTYSIKVSISSKKLILNHTVHIHGLIFI